MPRAERSLLTDVALDLVRDVREIIDYYKENPVDPPLTEKVSRGEAAKRFKAMTEEQRAEIIRQQGLGAVLDLLRKGK